MVDFENKWSQIIGILNTEANKSCMFYKINNYVCTLDFLFYSLIRSTKPLLLTRFTTVGKFSTNSNIFPSVQRTVIQIIKLLSKLFYELLNETPLPFRLDLLDKGGHPFPPPFLQMTPGLFQKGKITPPTSLYGLNSAWPSSLKNFRM